MHGGRPFPYATIFVLFFFWGGGGRDYCECDLLSNECSPHPYPPGGKHVDFLTGLTTGAEA